MIKWIKETFPDSYEFIRNFFKALNNKSEGHSLRKWLAIGFFWVIAEAVLRYTDENNLVSVITVLSGMITSLIITYTVGNYQEKKLEKIPPPTSTNESTG